MKLCDGLVRARIIYLIVALFLVSCGSERVADISSTAPKETSTQRVVTVQSILAEMEKGRYVDGEVLVKFRSGVVASQSLKVHQGIDASVLKRFTIVPNLEHVRLPDGVSVRDAVIKYMSDPNVEYAEPNYIRRIAKTPNDTYFAQQWALHNTGSFANGTPDADIDAPEAWDIKTGSSSIVVAVIDTGIDYNHEDLIDNIWRNQAENCLDGIDNDGNGYVDDCLGWDFTTCSKFDPNPPYSCITAKSRDNDPWDDNGHGTHVAGIIGARGDNGRGVSGVMWDVRLMPLKVLNADGYGTEGDIISGIEYAVMMKNRGANIKVINASLGGYSYSQAQYDAIASANTSGILFVVAAGNEGFNNDSTPFYPASYNLPNIISVAATDQNDRMASFSNFGTNTVHVGAPGVYILSTVPNNGYEQMEFYMGTSMAAPHVSGLVGLLYTYYTNFNHNQIRSTILRYVDIKDPSYGLNGWTKTGGRINAYRAISSLLIPSNLTAAAASSTSITLSWKDNATGEDGYRIERKVSGGSYATIKTLGPNATSYTDSGLSPSTTYFYRVIAYNDIGESPSYSNEASATTPAVTESTGGGGGGCSIAAGKDTGSDVILIFVPILTIVIFMLRRKM